jgi:hypothetical protein
MRGNAGIVPSEIGSEQTAREMNVSNNQAVEAELLCVRASN